MTKLTANLFFFKKDGQLINEQVVSSTGTLYLEKKAGGKCLHYTKGNITKSMVLNKKNYKALKRFAYGPMLTREYEDTQENKTIQTCLEYADNNFKLYRSKHNVKIKTTPKKIAPLVIEIFQYNRVIK